MTSDLIIYRRRLPHWRLPEYVYLVTWRLHFTQDILNSSERDLIVSALTHFNDQRYRLFAYVVMDDHIHVLIRPFENYRLQDIIHTWKSFTANKLQRYHGRKQSVWQEEYFYRIVRDECEFLEKVKYILHNPVKRWPELEAYNWFYVQEDLLAGTEARPTLRT